MSTHEEHIIKAIELERDAKVLDDLYKRYRGPVFSYIRKNNGSLEDAQDIFQEALIIFYKHVIDGKFNPKFTIGGFIFSISKNLWINQAQRNKRIYYTDNLLNNDQNVQKESTIMHHIITDERDHAISSVLNELDERCRTLLKHVIYDNMKMDEISNLMGFSSANTAKTKHYKCKKRLITIVQKYPNFKDILTF